MVILIINYKAIGNGDSVDDHCGDPYDPGVYARTGLY